MRGEVPEGWDSRQIQQVAEVLLSNVDKKSMPGERHVRLCNYMDVYRNPRITNQLDLMEATASDEQIAKFSLRTGDVMITKDSEDPKDIAVPAVVAEDFDEPVLCGYHLALLRPRRIDGEYLAWALRAREVNEQFVRRANGSTRFGLTAGVIGSTAVPVPPLPEQKKIAAILSSVDDAIRATQAVIDQTRRVKEGLLHDLLTRGIGPDGKPHTRFKQTEIGMIPEGWEVVRLEDMGRASEPVLRTGPFGSSLKGEHFTPTGRPVLNIQSLGIGELVGGYFYVSEEKAAELVEYEVRTGDIVFSRVADVGRSVTIPPDADGWIISSNLMRIRLNLSLCLPPFIMYQITDGPALQKQLSQTVNDAGRQIVNGSTMRRLCFPVPPLTEQQDIVERVSAFEYSRRSAAASLSLLESAKSALLSDLLTGRVRVTP